MVCKNCDPKLIKSGEVIKATEDLEDCLFCGSNISQTRWDYERESLSKLNKKWDTYFHSICTAVASKSPCLSRKIGAILVRDKSIISTGYNGPPRGVPHCGHERIMEDGMLGKLVMGKGIGPDDIKTICPRKLLGYESGTHLELCPSQHAEENAVSNAARLGVSVLGSTLYMNSVIPCKNCFGTLINAGIVEIVVEKAEEYDVHTKFLVENSNIEIREFEL